MNAELAALFLELLCNAGWLDDTSELIRDLLDSGVPESDIRTKCQLIDNTIREANVLLVDTYPPTSAKTESTLNRLLK